MKIKLNLQNKDHEISLEKGQTLLEAAIVADLDPPYSCEAGVCGECKAKLLDGEVTMEADDGLTEEDIAGGYILTCQSHPSSDVTIKYENEE